MQISCSCNAHYRVGVGSEYSYGGVSGQFCVNYIILYVVLAQWSFPLSERVSSGLSEYQVVCLEWYAWLCSEPVLLKNLRLADIYLFGTRIPYRRAVL